MDATKIAPSDLATKLDHLNDRTRFLSSVIAQINPFVTSVFYKDKNLYELFTQSEGQKAVDELLFAIENSPRNAQEKKTVESVSEYLQDDLHHRTVEDYSLKFNRLLDEMYSVFIEEFGSEETTESRDLRNDFSQSVGPFLAESGVIRKKLPQEWVIYPPFFKSFISATNTLSALIGEKRKNILTEIDERRKNNQSDTGNRSLSLGGLPLNISSDSASSRDGGKTTSEKAEQAASHNREEVKKISMRLNALESQIEHFDMSSTNANTIEDLLQRNFDLNLDQIGLLKTHLPVDFSRLQELFESRRLHAVPRTPTSVFVDENHLPDALVEAVQNEARKNGSPLTSAQIDALVFRGGYPRLNEVATQQLVQVSQKTLLRVTPQAQKTAKKTGKEQLLEFLSMNKKIEDSFTNYAAAAAYLEFIPTELIDRLKEELPLSPPELKESFSAYFTELYQSQKKLTGGKVFRRIDDLGDPKLAQLIRQANAEFIEGAADLANSVHSPAMFHRIMSVPIKSLLKEKEQKKTELTELQEKLQTLLEEKKAESEQAKQQLQFAVFQAQENLRMAELEASIAQQHASTLTPKPNRIQVLLGVKPQQVDTSLSIASMMGAVDSDAPVENNSSMSSGQQLRTSKARAVSLLGNGKKLKGTAQFARAIQSNRVMKAEAAGIGLGIGSLISSLSSTAILGTTSIGGVLGAIGGGLIAGVPGAAIGFGLGSFGGNVLGRALFPATSSSFAQTANTFAGSLAKSTPGTLANASGSLSGVGGNVGSALGKVINSTLSATGNTIAGISSVAPTLNVTSAVLVPVAIVGTTAFFATTIGIDGAFIMQGDIATCQKSDGISICKTNDILQAPNPTKVTYTIEIKAEEGKTAVINSATDSMVVRKSSQGDAPQPPALSPEAQASINTLINQSVDSNHSLKVQYTVDFGAEFDQTQIINTIAVGYSANGQSKQTKATSQVIFGQVSFGEGCWPTTGLIRQGPFGRPTHCHIDSIDIFANDEGGPNAPIFTPFDGNAEFFCVDSVTSGCPYVYSLPIYGNAVRLTLDPQKYGNGFDGKPKVVIFGHLSQFTNQFHPGDKVKVVKGTQLGFMGNSGSGMSGSGGATADFSEHLHYEYRNNTRDKCEGAFPDSQLFNDGIVPQPIIMDETVDRHVPETQTVRYDACGTSTSSPGTVEEGKVVASVSCLSFVDGNKAWSTTELNSYKSEMQKLLALPNVNSALCGDKKTIQIIRYDSNPNSETEGCNFNGAGESGAEWTGLTTLKVCDKLFADTSNTFGIYSMWHEPGHAFINKHQAAFASWPDFSPNYLPTDPLTSTRTEDFAESFGLCYYNLNRNSNFMTSTTLDAIFRGKTVQYDDYKNQCSKLESIVGSVAANTGAGF